MTIVKALRNTIKDKGGSAAGIHKVSKAIEVLHEIEQNESPITKVTVAAEAAGTSMFNTLVSAMQTGVEVTSTAITGTLKYLDTGELATYWGAGYFLALKFTDIAQDITSVKVGLDPSVGSGLVEIITDPDKNGAFKITDKDVQNFKVVVSNGKNTITQSYDLSNLVLEAPAPVDEDEN